ncbi:heparinase II/III domain-containing protein [Halanaerobium kushneri]|uniref:Heparinase II/III-like protein n=1 Tax=Halanaerobium kushneri TaxID=56779 RepID=A0A1N6ZY07_9FIRM|nr:heparinase II/III family protein [Halanaerobium kushneri]SIR31629.1 Heparinase II/III-like protein [Halanaerobium kushneri]
MNFYDLEKALESNSSRNNLFSADIKSKINQLKMSKLMQKELIQIEKSAEKFIEKSLAELTFRDFKIYFENGSRKEYENKYFQRREALVSLAVMALLSTEDEKGKYLDALEEVIWEVCAEFTWALPAHLDWDSYNPDQESESKLLSLKKWQSADNFIEDSREVIDLFAAETAFALAEIGHLLETELDSLIISRIKSEIRKRILLPFSDLKNSYHWESLKMNWSAVCAASIGSTAIYLLEDTAELSRILDRVIKSLEVYLSSFAGDGISQEGPSYWNYGFSFYTYFAELLKKRTDNQIDLLSDAKVKKIAFFQQKFYLSGDQVISFSDTPLTFNFRAGLSSKLKENFSELKLPELEYRADFHSDSCYRWPHIIRDLFWLQPEFFAEENEGDQGLDKLDQSDSYSYEADAEWLIYKNKFKGKKLAIAAKAGNNNEPHNHNDLGSFIYHFAGESFLVDPGSGEYSRDYFGSHRYDYLVNSSRGHSTALIGGEVQFAGEAAFITENDFIAADDRLKFSFRLDNAYSLESLNYYQRQFKINRKKGQFFVEDSFKFSQAESLTERFVSFFEPEQTADDLIKLQGANNSVFIKFEAELFNFKLNSEEFTAHSGERKKLYLLDFELKKRIKEEKFKFEIFPDL